MSDADASIRSLYSGHTVGDRDPADSSACTWSSAHNQALSEPSKLLTIPAHLDARRSHGSPNTNTRSLQSGYNPRIVSDNSSMLLHTSPRLPMDARLRPDVPDFYDGKNNSTNISLISASSDYQHDLLSDYPESDAHEAALIEPHSRPLSRNSVTSCLSTTATKDGVEGKRVPKLQTKLFDSKVHSFQGFALSSDQANFGSSPSDLNSKLRSELDSMSLPPISLKEKVQMMNDTTATSNGQVNE